MPIESRSRIREEHYQHDGRTLADLLKELRDESIRLFRQEINLAKTEMSEKASLAGRNVAYLATGGAIAYAGLLLVLVAAAAGLYAAFVAAGLSHMISGWLAPLIVGGVVLAIGYGLVQKAISTLRSESLTPERTVESLRDDKNWIKEKVS
jgi:hypothetical protein